MVRFSSDSSKAAASSAAFVSVDKSKNTIILAAGTQKSNTHIVSSIHQVRKALMFVSACPTSQSVRYGVRVLAEVGLVEALCVAVSKQSGDLLLQNRSNHLGQLLAVRD